MNFNKEFRPKLHWGTPLWGYIHSLIKNTKDIEITNTIQILINLDKCIPCVKCIKIYSDSLLDIDINMNKDKLFKWSVDLHNKVNKKFNKSEWTYEMALEEWKNSSTSYYLWNFIHMITIIDFENNKKYNEETKNVLLNLSICFDNLEEKNIYEFYLEKLRDLDMTKNMVLFYWSIDIHNEINKLYNKSEWSYNIALEKWANISRYKESNGLVIRNDSLSGPSGSSEYLQGPSGPSGSSEYLQGPSGPSGSSEYLQGPSGSSGSSEYLQGSSGSNEYLQGPSGSNEYLQGPSGSS
jgi:hypothetical protein